MKTKFKKSLMLVTLASVTTVATLTPCFIITCNNKKTDTGVNQYSNFNRVIACPTFRKDWGYSNITQAASYENRQPLEQKINDLIANKDVLNTTNIKSIELGTTYSNNRFNVTIILNDGYAFLNGEAVYNGEISFNEYEPKPNVAETNFSSMSTLEASQSGIADENINYPVPTPIFRTDWGSSETQIPHILTQENQKTLQEKINDLIKNASDFNENNVANITLDEQTGDTKHFNVKIELKDGYVFEKSNLHTYDGSITFNTLVVTPDFRNNFKSTEDVTTWVKQKNSLSTADKNKEFLIGNTIDNDYISSIDLQVTDKIKNQFNITITLRDGLFKDVRDEISGNRMNQVVSSPITYTQYWILDNPVIKPVLAKNALDYVTDENAKELKIKYEDLIANKNKLKLDYIKDIKLEANDKDLNSLTIHVLLKDNHFFQMKDSKELIASWISTIALSMQVANPTLRTGFATTLALKEWIPLVNNTSSISAKINMLFKDNVLTSGNTASINVEMADEANNLFNITITLRDGYGFAGGEKTLTLNNIVFKQLNALDLPTMKNQDKSTITQHEATILDWWASLNSLEKQVNSVNDLLASPINIQTVKSININPLEKNQFTFTIFLKTGYLFQIANGTTSDNWTSQPITYEQHKVINEQQNNKSLTIGLAVAIPIGVIFSSLLTWFITVRVKRKTK